MKALNAVLILLLVACCLSLVTSRQQQRLDYTAMVQAQKQAMRLDQDYQNLKTSQQALENSERVARVARKQMKMEHAPSGRVDYASLGAPLASHGAASGGAINPASNPESNPTSSAAKNGQTQ